jgi:hypothetical protein
MTSNKIYDNGSEVDLSTCAGLRNDKQDCSRNRVAKNYEKKYLGPSKYLRNLKIFDNINSCHVYFEGRMKLYYANLQLLNTVPFWWPDVIVINRCFQTATQYTRDLRKM